MRVTLYTDELRAAPVDLIAVGVFSDEPDRGISFSEINRDLEGALEVACRSEAFKGNAAQTVVFNAGDAIPARRVLVYGFGKRSQYCPEIARAFAGEASRTALKVGAKTVALQLTVLDAPAPEEHVLRLIRALSEGARLGAYRYDDYRTKDRREHHLSEVRIAFVAEDVVGLRGSSLRAAVVRGERIAEGVKFARDLVNAPPNDMTPNELAERAKKMAKASELSCKIFNARDLEKQGMLLHHGVGKGSRNEPRLIHVTYTPEKKGDNLRTIVLVGKGITFDSGGLSIKTSEGMMSMKVDMGGAASVLGAMQAVAALQPNVIVHGVVAAAENMPGGDAIRPGDVIRSKKGLTVEVMNTDAEGRLVLADALAYAQELKPTAIIDLATLTGACMVALGKTVAGAFVNDSRLADDLKRAWQSSGERFWLMPLEPTVRPQLDSDVADIKNIGERYGGAISAALFLSEFIDDGVRWAHFDIAGPVVETKENGYQPKGGTGFGVRTLIEYIDPVAT